MVAGSVKTERPPSPRLVATHGFNPHADQFHPFRFQLHERATQQPRDPSSFRVGLPGTQTNSTASSSPAMASNAASTNAEPAGLNWPAGMPAYTLPFHEYDDDEEDDSGPRGAKDKAVRRRSSKGASRPPTFHVPTTRPACDQCRKSKCKCERTAPDAPCRSCVMLKLDCTFLGPSRKRGPPKGYIDAIEARLHQTEALVGILLAAGGVKIIGASDDDVEDGRGRNVDERAAGLMADLATDPVAKAILVRIDLSTYGPAGRKAAVGPSSGRNSASGSGRGSPAGPAKMRSNGAGADGDLGSMHPSHEWMDRVTESILRRRGQPHLPQYAHPPQRPAINTSSLGDYAHRQHGYPQSAGALGGDRSSQSYGAEGPSFRTGRAMPLSATADGRAMPFGSGGDGRRLRRRVDDGTDAFYRNNASQMSPDASGSDGEMDLDLDVEPKRGRRQARLRERPAPGLEGLAGAVGQLSLNEDKEVRYHGKASGLHLLARRPVPASGEENVKKEEDGQNAGGIWRFPKARVWPAAPAPDEWDADGVVDADKDGLPPKGVQEALLRRYFEHVHPSFPVVHKQSVMDAFFRGDSPPLLLLAMYALAARHAPQPPASEIEVRQCMWPAGDTFLFRAKGLLDNSYASSRASTVAALLLMGFREIGIGAMAQAWIYIGMAVRMAQDLGMHRDADGWVRAGVKVGKGRFGTPASPTPGVGDAMQPDAQSPCADGDLEGYAKDGKLFTIWEIAERRRIWYACVIMDKYVSTYIGRPLAIFERDFDTSLPSETDVEEAEEWSAEGQIAPRPGRIISCFNASARLANILSQILQSIYALRTPGNRYSDLHVLDGELEKWRLALPLHLQYDPAYWCAVLLLYRPFIRQSGRTNKSPTPDDPDGRGRAEKSYELCAGAANHITTIVALYSETYTLKHCAVFLCYYTFTASIMHVTSLFSYPQDPQARLGLSKCMEALQEMEIIWPAAARALVLLRTAEATLADVAAEMEVNGGVSVIRTRKRSATHTLEDSFPAANSNAFVGRAAAYPGSFDANGHYAIASGSREPFYGSAPASYPRWSSGADGGAPIPAGAFSGGGPLSTAVMGPTYSTGLDERHHAQGRAEQPRYPQQQYWSDYVAGSYGAPPQTQPQPQSYDGIPVSHGGSSLYPPTIHPGYNVYSHHGQ
ncbi:Zn(2)-C6 fungal-type domain-containing protein [Mycena kentingensis (nom. inval.)]|nr:Zn(2)-C6 fungal-type domain-containing protein [Mycena kentingensis (nom. inval.)]